MFWVDSGLLSFEWSGELCHKDCLKSAGQSLRPTWLVFWQWQAFTAWHGQSSLSSGMSTTALPYSMPDKLGVLLFIVVQEPPAERQQATCPFWQTGWSGLQATAHTHCARQAMAMYLLLSLRLPDPPTRPAVGTDSTHSCLDCMQVLWLWASLHNHLPKRVCNQGGHPFMIRAQTFHLLCDPGAGRPAYGSRATAWSQHHDIRFLELREGLYFSRDLCRCNCDSCVCHHAAATSDHRSPLSICLGASTTRQQFKGYMKGINTSGHFKAPLHWLLSMPSLPCQVAPQPDLVTTMLLVPSKAVMVSWMSFNICTAMYCQGRPFPLGACRCKWML